jgi:thiamine kinase-like enzyme
LINEIKDDKIVPCHNDLSIENMLIDKNNNVILIDYEWARMNSIYWECANFIRNTNYNLKQINLFCKLAKLNYEHMKKYLFICSCYAYQWTFNMPQTNKVLSYRKITFTKMMFYYNLLNEKNR